MGEMVANERGATTYKFNYINIQMLPYYLNLNKRLISDDLSEKLVKIATQYVDDFTDSIFPESGLKNGNSYISQSDYPELFKHKEIEELKNSCTLNFFPILIMHKPNTKVTIHIDNSKFRNCLIITPLFPKVNYAPTRFWENDKIVAVCNFDNFNSTLLNTQIYHDLENIDSYRFNLQFCFSEPINMVAHLNKTGQLFKN